MLSSIVGNTILVTGAAGFIGANLILKLLENCSNGQVIGVDNVNNYYDKTIKEYRLGQIDDAVLESGNEWEFLEVDISDKAAVGDIFKRYSPDIVVNLAAQAGVRYSIEHPDAYIESNLIGF